MAMSFKHKSKLTSLHHDVSIWMKNSQVLWKPNQIKCSAHKHYIHMDTSLLTMKYCKIKAFAPSTLSYGIWLRRSYLRATPAVTRNLDVLGHTGLTVRYIIPLYDRQGVLRNNYNLDPHRIASREILWSYRVFLMFVAFFLFQERCFRSVKAV